MTVFQIVLVLVAVALVLSPTLRFVGKWVVGRVIAKLESELKVAFPLVSDAIEKLPPLPSPGGLPDMHLVLDLAAKLREQGNAEAVKLCQALLDQMLQKKA